MESHYAVCDYTIYACIAILIAFSVIYRARNVKVTKHAVIIHFLLTERDYTLFIYILPVIVQIRMF